MLSVKTNMLAWNAGRQFKINEKADAKRTEKLSSGYRINRAADDAAGLSISEKMRRQIRGLTQASSNAQDGISMVQSAEGALNEVHEMLHRANELAVKAANGTLSDEDRAMGDAEVQQIKREIDNTAKNTVFNEIRLFPDDGLSPKAGSVLASYDYEVTFDFANGSVAVNQQANGVSSRPGVQVNSGSALADKIANQYIPNAVQQIFDAFPSFATAQGTTEIKMALNVKFIDGPGNTLALAGYTYSPSGGKPKTMYINVDAADFKDADIGSGSDKEKQLESTIAHELMHTVMQYNLTDGMSGRNGEKYPTWFVEGTAQLAGGGFPTNWNNELLYYADKLADEDDTSQDANIAKYLQKYTMQGRPYGHGYLGAAYIGYLANKQNGGSADVTGANIAGGMDLIFGDLIKGKKLDQAIKDRTGKSISEINGLFSSGNGDLTEFARKLAFNSKDGAGSVIVSQAAGGLGAGGAGKPIIGSGAGSGAFTIDPSQVNVDFSGGSANVAIQVGSEAGQHIDFKLYQMNTQALGLADMNVNTVEDASDAINFVKEAIINVSSVRSHYGAVQNRLEHTIANLDNVVENTTAAESRIRDTDMAKEMVAHANSQVLLQAGQSMLAQANRSSEIILGLLG